MAQDKAAESKLVTATQRSAELILIRLSDYLSVRFDHAGRINATLKAIKQDLMYHEIANVRRCLNGDKIYGPVRQHVADVFLGDDEKRRRGLMSATDQTSIQVELVSHCQDERSEATRGQIRIHDLKSFYAAIDANLSSMMDLIETWIWWDIPDAAELVRFEQKLGIIALARQGRISEEMRKRYVTLTHPVSTDEVVVISVSDEDIMRYEIRQLVAIRDQWAYRRQNERGFMYALKRDELPNANNGRGFHEIAVKMREYDAIESMDELDEVTRQRYATELRVAPERVTQEAVIEFLQSQILSTEREMLHLADQELQLGPPYNYKERQLDQMTKWLQDLDQQLRGVAVKAGEPVVASGGA